MISLKKLGVVLLGTALFWGGPACPLAWTQEARVLTHVSEIRTLSRKEAVQRIAVRVRGVVTWQSANPNGSFIVDDGVQGIGVDCSLAVERGFWKGPALARSVNEPGALVEIEGVTDPGGYAPVILPSKVTRVGSSALPPPRRVPMDRLLSGGEDSQRGEVEGVIQGITEPDEAGVSFVNMVVDGHRCRVIVERGHELDSSLLIDAKVRVRGVLAPMLNLRSEIAGLKINVMGASDFEVLVPPPPDPFLAPRVALDRLLPFSPDREAFHRKVISGVVTFVKPGQFFYLQENTTGLRVFSPGVSVSLGDQVEVSGFVQRAHTLASFRGALVRGRGPGPSVQPLKTSPEDILYAPSQARGRGLSAAEFSGRLLRIEGRLLKIKHFEDGSPRTLFVESGGQTFSAIPPETDAPGEDASWREGSRLALTGVCELDFAEGMPGENAFVVSGFRLWMRGATDVEVLQRASWWTPFRLHVALLGAGFVILVSLIALGLMRGVLSRRTRRLEEVMRIHRDTELEYISAQRERMRLAVDLHDGIKQHLAAASFRVEAAAEHLPLSPEAASLQLASAHHSLLRIQTELQDCLWGLHCVEEGPPDFVQLLDHVTARAEHWPARALTIKSEGLPRHIPRDVAGSLLLLFQEATGNAFRHGRARQVAVTVDYGHEALELCVRDDGSGFDPRTVPGPRAGHFGIDGMKRRMGWLRGTLQITRRAEVGMKVLARVPWNAMRATPLTESETPPLHSYVETPL